MKIEFVHSGIAQKFYFNGNPYHFRITNENVSIAGSNIKIIEIDTSLSSNLKWEKSIERANELIELGYHILWNLNLFSEKTALFLDEMTLLSKDVAIEHFVQTIWSTFHEFSIGVIVYQGTMHQYIQLQDELKILSASFPEDSLQMLLLDAELDPLTYLHLGKRDIFAHFLPIIKGEGPKKYPFAFPILGWDNARSPLGFHSNRPLDNYNTSKNVPLALHVHENIQRSTFDSVIKSLSVDFRVLNDDKLTHGWEGVEEMIVFSENLSSLSKRKLFGYSLTEGRLIIAGPPLGFPNETIFNGQKYS